MVESSNRFIALDKPIERTRAKARARKRCEHYPRQRVLPSNKMSGRSKETTLGMILTYSLFLYQKTQSFATLTASFCDMSTTRM